MGGEVNHNLDNVHSFILWHQFTRLITLSDLSFLQGLTPSHSWSLALSTTSSGSVRYYFYYCCCCLEKYLDEQESFCNPVILSGKSICTCTSSGEGLRSIWGLGAWVYLCSRVGCISLQILSKYDISHCSTNLPIQSFQYCFDSCAWLAIFEFPPNFYFPSNSEFELRTLSPWILYVSLLTFLSLPASTLVPSTSNLNIIFFSIQN